MNLGKCLFVHPPRFSTERPLEFSFLLKVLNLFQNLIMLMVDVNLLDITHRDVHERIQEKFWSN
ncbi:hypothetical protein BD769DRAFT_1507315, partial [Suillus cothurnatus]